MAARTNENAPPRPRPLRTGTSTNTNTSTGTTASSRTRSQDGLARSTKQARPVLGASTTQASSAPSTSRASASAPPSTRKRRVGKENENEGKDGKEKEGKEKEGKEKTKTRTQATPRRALSTVTQVQTEKPQQVQQRPAVRRTTTNPLQVGTSTTTVRRKLAAPTVRKEPTATAPCKEPAAARRKTPSTTPTPGPLAVRSPHTPEAQIGINPLKRAVPTTFDRPTGGRKFQRIGEVEEEPAPKRKRVLSDPVEECVPGSDAPFVPLTPPPPGSNMSPAHDAVSSPEAPPPPTLHLPPLDPADEVALDMPALLDAEQMQLELGELELPDIDFVL